MLLPIRLDQFLKHIGLAQTGGHAKYLIREGLVLVNGEIEQRRGRKLVAGDIVSCEGQAWTVQSETSS